MSEEEIEVTYKSGFVDLRKGNGWAAILKVRPDGYVEREFLKIDKVWGKKGFVFSFNARLKVGTVVEISQGGSWKNRYRDFFVVKPNGLELIGPYDSISAKEKVAELLGIKVLRFAPLKQDNEQ